MAATEPGTPAPVQARTPSSDEPLTAEPLTAEALPAEPLTAEPLTADLTARGPRVSTRVLVAVALVLVVLLVASVVVGFVVLHQPRLAPVPVPSVSSIA